MISDPFWKQSLLEAMPIEDECYGGYRMLLVASEKPVGAFIYPFRIFFFPKDEDEPILALNLELGSSGTCALGVHDLKNHYSYATEDPNMSVDEFKLWALETAKEYLTLTNERDSKTKETSTSAKEKWKAEHRLDRVKRKQKKPAIFEGSDDSAFEEFLPNRRYVPIILGVGAAILAIFLDQKFEAHHFTVFDFVEILLSIFTIGVLKIGLFSSKKEIFNLTTTHKEQMRIKQEIFNEQLNKFRQHP